MFDWLLRRLKTEDIVGDDGSLYLRRYFLLKTDRLKIYIHNIERSDDDRGLHCHPWNFVSIILKGRYWEVTPDSIEPLPGETAPRGAKYWGRFSVIKHKAEDAHRLILHDPVWTLVFLGKKRREWGFYTPKGWVHWKDYIDEKFGATPRLNDHEVAQARKYMEE